MSPRPRFKKLNRETQEAILQAAIEEFSANGLAGASYNRIIEKSGVSKGAMYYYFDDKADLYITAFRGVLAEIAQRMGGLALLEFPTDDFWAEIRDFHVRMTAYSIEQPLLIGLAKTFYMLPHGAGAPEPVAQFMSEARDWVARLLRVGQELGAVRQDVPLSLLVYLSFGVGEAFDLWGLEHWNELDEADIERIIDLNVDTMQRVLAESKED